MYGEISELFNKTKRLVDVDKHVEIEVTVSSGYFYTGRKQIVDFFQVHYISIGDYDFGLFAH